MRIGKLERSISTWRLNNGGPQFTERKLLYHKFNAFYICQSFNQLVAKYGDAGANELKNTCSYHIFYTQNEIRVAEEISKSIGKFTRKKTSHSSQSGSMSKNTSESDEGVPLILPQEIMSLPFGEILVCAQGNFQTPVKCNAALFFKIPSLQQAIKNSSWNEKNKVSMTSATPEALPASLAPVENKPEGVDQENNFNDEQVEVA